LLVVYILIVYVIIIGINLIITIIKVNNLARF